MYIRVDLYKRMNMNVYACPRMSACNDAFVIIIPRDYVQPCAETTGVELCYKRRD